MDEQECGDLKHEGGGRREWDQNEDGMDDKLGWKSNVGSKR